MSLYDYIQVDVPLPDDYDGSDEFRTRDFGRQLSTHFIRHDGLYLDNGHYDDVAATNQRYPNKPEHDIPSALNGKRWIPKLERQAYFTGDVEFYGFDYAKVFRTFLAKFINGGLVEISQINQTENL